MKRILCGLIIVLVVGVLAYGQADSGAAYVGTWGDSSGSIVITKVKTGFELVVTTPGQKDFTTGSQGAPRVTIFAGYIQNGVLFLTMAAGGFGGGVINTFAVLKDDNTLVLLGQEVPRVKQ